MEGARCFTLCFVLGDGCRIFGTGARVIQPGAYYYKMKNEETVWVKWHAQAPVGYVKTGVYCASTDSYLFKKISLAAVAGELLAQLRRATR